jgi:hypothetical protein
MGRPQARSISHPSEGGSMSKCPPFEVDGDWVRELMRRERIDTIAVVDVVNQYIRRMKLRFREVTEPEIYNALARARSSSEQHGAAA